MPRGENDALEKITQKWFKQLRSVCNLLITLLGLGVAAFAIGPLVVTTTIYFTQGELKFFLPFIVWYPFDAYTVTTWPFVYLQQLWTACVAILAVYGPDSFFLTCCTFIHTQFLYLQEDMKEIVKEGSWKLNEAERVEIFRKEFVQVVDRHRDLIRCVQLLDAVYSKSTLLNFMTSSLIICATGFNLMAIENIALMAPFCAFLSFGMLQVFCYCHYGDNVMISSTGVGDAIYDSRWYEAGATERKYMLTVIIRSQKPCKFTAYGFADVNLKAFTRILSTSWSYFALLNQVYHD
ncbi:odorant receptor 4-like [Anticarsia gemmatalis]|uniref:odorant receptor 4-like n=1 Tax=Anticarsia gemmatalis TaxID=129554 RepID=UPI003F7611D1